ncbi:ATP phosphoribosyltransferase [Cutibacterium acnes JCM 18918]|nr:ATP phosphoribosyltransferase [Cutibacterium acnes JCM 18918]
MSDLLRIAVPNKGALSEAASSLLAEAGYRQRTDHKDLTLVDEENGVEFFYLRPRDIAVYVGEGTSILVLPDGISYLIPMLMPPRSKAGVWSFPLSFCRS